MSRKSKEFTVFLNIEQQEPRVLIGTVDDIYERLTTRYPTVALSKAQLRGYLNSGLNTFVVDAQGNITGAIT